jgi:hypothetical protein
MHFLALTARKGQVGVFLYGRVTFVYIVVYFCILLTSVHVRRDPCPHSMARPRVADGGTASRYGG